MTIEEKKKAVEEFLEKQEGDQKPVEVSEEKVEEKATTPAPFAGRYKSDTGLFRGGFEGSVELPEAPTEEPPPAPTQPIIPPPPETYDEEILKLLSIIGTNQGTFIRNQDRIIANQGRSIENQEVERKSWERNNPLITDSPVYDWEEATIDPGYQVIFTLTIPEGSVFFFEYFNITYNVDSTYYITIDSVGDPTLPTINDVLQDFGDHLPMFKPPRLCYSSVVISALNNGVIAETYSVFIRGWFRQTIKTDKEYLGSR